jgi:hypothetical protein
VGDVVSLEAEVSSFLPQTLTLWDVTLTLSVLEMPRSSFSGWAAALNAAPLIVLQARGVESYGVI